MYIKWIVYYLNESIKSVTLWFIYVGVSYCGSLGCHCCSLGYHCGLLKLIVIKNRARFPFL